MINKTSLNSRRQFIHQLLYAGLITSIHPSCLLDKHQKSPTTSPHKKTHLIQNIRLLTHVALTDMIFFYRDKLGLPLIHQNENEISFQAGKSSVTFVKINPELGKPFYHFAFNIPENKILKARAWQLERSEIVLTPKRLRDPNYPNDIRHFSNWNAHSVFFIDPAGNVLEYIARHDLDNSTPGDFSTKDILNISEIAFVVDDQNEMAQFIHKNIGLSEYPKQTNHWWSMGDEHGLLLAIPKRIWGENTDQPKRFDVFKTEATIIGQTIKKIKLIDYPYEVFVQASKS